MKHELELVEFISRLQDRVAQGDRSYGDHSFSRNPLALITEIQEELLDVAGWGFILWTRLEGIRKALEVSDVGASHDKP
jgi:hypothetical protein